MYFSVVGSRSSSHAANREFLEALTNRALELNIKVGIYSSYADWENLMGLDYQFPNAASYPLWYPHYDTKHSFDGFKAFGGWTTPFMKQYDDDDCHTCLFEINKNYRP